MAEEGEVIIRRRWPRVLAVVALLLGILALSLWLARKPIARGEVDSYLKTANVPARYTISDLGLGRQRLTDVVIGNPADPDLVADWLETRTDWGLRGPYLASVRGGHVRVRARWVDGKLSLGSIDRLLPTGGGGKPFALPKLALDVDDLRARIETPWGLIGAKLTGSGRLDDGFDGRLALVAPRVAAGSCVATDVRVASRLRIDRGAPSLKGPARADTIACGQNNARGVAADLTLGLTRDLVDWRAGATLAVDRVAAAGTTVNRLTGRADAMRSPFKVGGAGARGSVDLRSGRFDAIEVAGEGTRLAGRFFYAPTDVMGRSARLVVTSAMTDAQTPGMRLSLTGARLRPERLATMARLAQAGAGTPIGPLAAQLARAVAAAGRRFDLDADVQPEIGDWEQGVTVHRLDLRAASGGRATFGGRLTYYRVQRFGEQWVRGRGWIWRGGPGSGLTMTGVLATGGGGLPTATTRLDQLANNRPVTATVAMQPYTAGGARLALTGTRIVWTPGPDDVAVTTRATLSGPLGDGRVEGLTLPIDATWRDGALALESGCVPLGWARLAVAGLTLDPATLRLCPEGAALVQVAGGRLDGGARVAAARVTGRLGSTPLTLATTGGRVGLAARGFALTGVEAQIGAPDRATRLTAGTLDGRFGTALAGHFADAGGRIGNVPLAMSAAAGTWRFANGALAVDGALTVADTEAVPRFQPLAARGVTLTLAGNRIDAAGVLREPATGTKVADVAIRHDLAAGRGTADLTVPSLAFVKGFQPDQLTKLTFGVIADVRGTVTGDAHLAWTPDGVTSTGVFRTAGTDLAAAFGPVTGLAGEIRFTDLLQLQSAPGQRVTVKSINPGVPVTDGVITFQTLPGTRVQIEDARWPFAGGTLTLDPTLLDFSGTAERRMTFHVTGAAADQFLQSFDFKNLDATGVFDGVLPMVFDATGGRIENGRLAVRPGGGTLAYVGDISRKNLGFWGNFAFDTLKSLRYRSLAIGMNGPLAGEMVTEVRFTGISQGKGAKSNFLIRRLQRLPVVFNIRIRAPFRGLLDSTASFYDPKRLIERNLPELIERQQPKVPAIQPPASETMP